MLEGVGGVNWRLVARVAAGWVATLVVCGLTAGAFFAAGVYSPSLPCSRATAAWSSGVHEKAQLLADALGAAADGGSTGTAGGRGGHAAALKGLLESLAEPGPPGSGGDNATAGLAALGAAVGLALDSCQLW